MTGPRITREQLGHALARVGYDPATGANQDLGEALGLLPYWGTDVQSRANTRRVALREPQIIEPDGTAARNVTFNGLNRSLQR